MKMMIKLFVVSVLSFFVVGSVSAQEVTLKFHHMLSPKSPAHAKMIMPWVKRVEKASKGRLKINVYPSMSLGGKPPQLIR